MLHTRIGSQGYAAPELLGLLMPGSNTSEYCDGVDMWSLGCVVHELLTTEIPFLEARRTETMMSGLDTELADEMPQQDLSALKAYCDGTSEFSTDVLRLSGASDGAIIFVKSLLVPSPGSRATAEAASQSQWLLNQPASLLHIVFHDTRRAQLPVAPFAAKIPSTRVFFDSASGPLQRSYEFLSRVDNMVPKAITLVRHWPLDE